MGSPELASGPDLRAVSEDERRAARLLWAAIDSPWVHNVDVGKYAATGPCRPGSRPSAILSTHLPPAIGLNDAMIDVLVQAPSGPEFVGPDQAALEAVLASFEPAV